MRRAAPRKFHLVAVLAAIGCGGAQVSPSPGDQARDDQHLAELGAFMKLRMNPPFSTLALVLFHEEEGGDPREAVEALQASVGELRRWPDPPVGSEQAKQVFVEYAGHLERDVAELKQALAEGHRAEAPEIFDRLRRTCDSCHHFFRFPKEGAQKVDAGGRLGVLTVSAGSGFPVKVWRNVTRSAISSSDR